MPLYAELVQNYRDNAGIKPAAAELIFHFIPVPDLLYRFAACLMRDLGQFGNRRLTLHP